MATPTPSTNTPSKHLAAFSSPAPRSIPGMINFDSPAALGLSLESVVGMGISMSGMGMSGMGMSGMGLTASAMGRADEDDRRRRLEAVIATLKMKPGRVSEEGIIALCKKEGLEVMREPQSGNRAMLTLLIGNEAMCEIQLRDGEIDTVKLELASDRPEIGYGTSGSKILLQSLRPLPGMTRINLTLERFSHNLDKLLRMDKLSAPENGGVSCYQAVFGVYTSLKKLFEHEKKMALAVMDASTPYADQKAEREVLCKKSGRPRINAGSCIGLSLEYWMDRRHIIPPKPHLKSASTKGKDKMDIDSPPISDLEEGDPDINKIYSLTIECESSPSSMYSPIRISDSWISSAIEKPADSSDINSLPNLLLNRPTLDWLEPAPTYLPSAVPEGSHDAMNLDTAPGRLPNIRFIAKFNPPLVVPLSVVVTIHQSLGLDVPQDIRPTTFVGLALRPGEADPGLAGIAGEGTLEVQSEKRVLVPTTGGGEEERIHANSLYVPKTEYSRAIESLPFQHPRQLVDILPTLRQFAFTTSLLQYTFLSPSPSAPPGQNQNQSQNQTQTSHSLDLKSLTTTPPLSAESRQKHMQLDATLSYAQPLTTTQPSQPTPRLSIHLPHPSSSPQNPNPNPTSLLSFLLSGPSAQPNPPLTLTFDVLPNADLNISDQNVVRMEEVGDGGGDGGDRGDGGVQGFQERIKRVARALEISGDLGVWGEWLRREVSRE
ncbi:mediator of RNA polymerase II transcription subunit 1-domain-containing protein [Clohesyomyces aquaticus]|uniref:Mediator of RNA polymerase II transcription subunit 1 n=1 Tax=Clohesyomyces aquaticus TaxID=1231657 RepID=A0A1Y1ZCY5_9PLEO|nr:mediator of RNA polymerase II transcription subunit 1-domain-containing protein [Clohesyomyces aquaticus]